MPPTRVKISNTEYPILNDEVKNFYIQCSKPVCRQAGSLFDIKKPNVFFLT